MSDSFVTHGARPSKGNGKKRKGVDEYAAENCEDFVSKSIIREGQQTRVLVCRFCCVSVGARSDRIKEHLSSKRHNKMKLEHSRAVQEDGDPEAEEYSASDLFGASEKDKVLPPQLQQVIINPPPHQQPENMPLLSSPYSSEGTGSGEEMENGGDDFWSTTSSNTETYSPTLIPQPLMNVKWNSYNSNLISMFSSMRRKGQFVDVTLMCEGKGIKCHRIVLAACSPYFATFFKLTPNPTVVMISDIRFWELESLVEFMYSGEVKVGQDQLQNLFRAAKIYQVSGLGSQSLQQGLLGITMESENVRRGSPPPANLHHVGFNASTKANDYQTPAEFMVQDTPVMGVDMATGETKLGTLASPYDLNNGNPSSLPLRLSDNWSLDGDGGGRGVSSQATYRKRKKATRRLGNSGGPRGVPLLLPILPFFNPNSNQSSIGTQGEDVSKSEKNKSHSVWNS